MTDTPDEAPQQDFSVALVNTDKGRLNETASHELTELLKAVRETNKPGSITITLKITPDKGSGGERVVVAGSVTTKKPAFDPRTSIFFLDEDGGMHRNDPRQHELFEQESNAR
ncbi:hypothetical protein ACIRG5_42510 [Lentzea sp. NPDC102401]|uniref:hypothetical protein n=1 Tax=Lentzea sp. NPDC102401 TaxID=3364128 RepID=UPI0038148A6E